jgi:hypothetical protein
MYLDSLLNLYLEPDHKKVEAILCVGGRIDVPELTSQLIGRLQRPISVLGICAAKTSILLNTPIDDEPQNNTVSTILAL